MTTVQEYYGDHGWTDENGATRRDIWPFQQVPAYNRRSLSKQRVLARLKFGLAQVPEGWKVKWLKKRAARFHINVKDKVMSLHFPKNNAGLATLAVALHIAGIVHRQGSNRYQIFNGDVYGPRIWDFNWWRDEFRFHQLGHKSFAYGISALKINSPTYASLHKQAAKFMLNYITSRYYWSKSPAYTGHVSKSLSMKIDAKAIKRFVKVREMLCKYLCLDPQDYPFPPVFKKAAATHKVQL